MNNDDLLKYIDERVSSAKNDRRPTQGIVVDVDTTSFTCNVDVGMTGKDGNKIYQVLKYPMHTPPNTGDIVIIAYANYQISSGYIASIILSAQNDPSTITVTNQAPKLTTKGDLLTYSTSQIRFPVGANGYALVADSTSAAGIRWGGAQSIIGTADVIQLLARGNASQTVSVFDVTDSGGTNHWLTVRGDGRVNLSAGSTVRASLNFAAGAAPTSPGVGDMWSDGTDLFARGSGGSVNLTSGNSASTIINVTNLSRSLRTSEAMIIGTHPNSFHSPRTTGSGTTSRLYERTPAAVSAVRVTYCNYGIGGWNETPNTNQIVVRASIELIDSTGNVSTMTNARIPVYFNGKRDVIVAGDELVTSDWVRVAMPAGQRYFVRTYVSTPTVGAPTAATLTATTGGTLGNLQYQVGIVAVYPDGIFSLPLIQSITLSGNTAITVSGVTMPAGAIGYRVFMCQSASAATNEYETPAGTVASGASYTILSNPGAYGQPVNSNAAGWYPGSGLLGGNTFQAFGVNSTLGTGDGLNVGANYVDDSSGGSNSSSNGGGVFSPVVIEGLALNGTLPSIAIIGDSISEGTGDGGFYTNNGGFLERALTAQFNLGWTYATTPLYGMVKTGASGEALHTFADWHNSRLRVAVASRASHVISNYGTNDLASGSAQMCGDLLTVAGWFTGQNIPFFQCTLVPKTTSTDGWTTLANQTMQGNQTEGARRQFNNYMLDATGAIAVTNETAFCSYTAAGGSSTNFYPGTSDGTTVKYIFKYPALVGSITATVNGSGAAVTAIQTSTINGNTYATGVTLNVTPTAGQTVVFGYTKVAGFQTNTNCFAFDTASAIEVDGSGTAGTNGGFWSVAGVTDAFSGTVATAASTAQFTMSGVPRLANQDKGRTIRWTSGANFTAGKGQCVSWNNASNVINLSGPMGSAIAGATPGPADTFVLYNGNTIDGTHPSTSGHILIAQAMVLSGIK